MGHDYFSDHEHGKHGKFRDDHDELDHRHGRDSDRDHDYSYDYGHGHEPMDFDRLKNLAGKILGNRSLLIVLAIIALVVLAGAIWLVFLLMPVLGKVLDFIIKNGLTGIYDYLLKILNQFLKGTGA